MSPDPSPNKIGKSVGEKIRAARVALRYTQSKLAAPDFSVSYISAIERGQIHPSLRALEILAGRLGMPSTEFLPQRSQQDGSRTGVLLQPEREDDEGEMLLLEVQVYISQNEPTKALALLHKIPAKRLKRFQQLWHRYSLGYAYFLLHQLENAEHIFSEMIPVAKEANNFYLHTHILFMLGNTFAAMRNPTQALFTHQRCLEVLEEAQARDIFLIARTLSTLATHHLELEQLQDAQMLLHSALDTFTQLQNAQMVEATYTALAQEAVAHQDYYAAELYGYRALSYFAEESRQQLKGNIYYRLGQAILRGNSDEVYSRLQALKAEEMSEPLMRASITARLAEWYFIQQNMQEALSSAEEAYTLARPFGKNSIAADALLTLGRIEYAQQSFDAGDKHFEQGLAMLEQLHQTLDLNEHLLRYAQLLEARGKAHEAFTYFRRAYQSRMS